MSLAAPLLLSFNAGVIAHMLSVRVLEPVHIFNAALGFITSVVSVRFFKTQSVLLR